MQSFKFEFSPGVRPFVNAIYTQTSPHKWLRHVLAIPEVLKERARSLDW